MIDMRGENESVLQPHSHVRHELMHNQYNRIKEDENHWQEVSVFKSSLPFFNHFVCRLAEVFVPSSRGEV